MKKYLIASLAVFLLVAFSALSFAADPTYGPKIYNKQGGDELVAADGGTITVESGGTIAIEDGGKITGLNLGAVASKVITLAESWVLSATEWICSLLSISSGSGAISIIAPDTAGKVFIVRNASLSGTVTIKISGGTGVSIAAGKTAVVMHNGTDYVRVTADATH